MTILSLPNITALIQFIIFILALFYIITMGSFAGRYVEYFERKDKALEGEDIAELGWAFYLCLTSFFLIIIAAVMVLLEPIFKRRKQQQHSPVPVSMQPHEYNL